MCATTYGLRGKIKKVIHMPPANHALIEIEVGQCASPLINEHDILTVLFICPTWPDTNFASNIKLLRNHVVSEEFELFIITIECTSCYKSDGTKIMTNSQIPVSKVTWRGLPFAPYNIVFLGCGKSFN